MGWVAGAFGVAANEFESGSFAGPEVSALSAAGIEHDQDAAQVKSGEP